MRGQDSAAHPPPSALILGFAGLIPFAAAALSQWLELPAFTPQMGLATGTAYGAVILSFLGGIRWGTAMKTFGNERLDLELSGSVLVALAGWLSLALQPVTGLCLLIAGLLLQALWDVISVERNHLPRWYGKFRMLLTAGAVLSLGAMLVHLTIS